MRRRLACTALVAGALAFAPTISAAESNPQPHDGGYGVTLGLRLGWGLPLGSRVRFLRVAQSFGPGSEFSGLLPVWVDAGYRVSRAVYVGGYFQYGFLLVPSSGCPSPVVGCHAYDIRGGLNVVVHFMTDRTIGPWLGLGTGYETSTITFEGADESSTRSNGGFEFVNLQAGVDFRSASRVDWGPFVSFSINEYLTETQTLPDGTSTTYSLSGSNARPTLHYFAVMGMRGAFDF